MNKEQRKFLADKLAGTANIMLGGLAVGQFLSDRPFQLGVFIVGLLVYIGLLATGLWLLKGDSNDGSAGT